MNRREIDVERDGQWFVIDPNVFWDKDRVVYLTHSREEAERVALDRSNSAGYPFVVAKIVSIAVQATYAMKRVDE